MKSCPTCNRTFSDETLSFCLVDGAILSAPYDPQATQRIAEAKQTQPTEVLAEEKIEQEIPPTIASPKAEQKPRDLVSTISAPAPVFESPQIEASPAQPARKFNQRMWITFGVLVLLIIGVAVVFMTRETASKHGAAGQKLSDDEQYVQAEAKYRKAINLEPNNGEWHYYLALTFEGQKKYAEAEAEYREALRLEGADIDRDSLNRVLAAQGKPAATP